VVAGLAQVAPQRPPEQSCPAAQALPQAPQWAPSVWRLVQVDPQAVSPVPQDTMHAPAEQVLPGGQALPQAPQWALSV